MSWLRKRGWIPVVVAGLWFAVSIAAAQEGDGEPVESTGTSISGLPEYGEQTLGYGPSVPKFGEDIYRVVRGDTLWGICSRFLGEAEQWPSLWSINNEEVTNPHYIYPGQLIRFKPGTDIYPPELLVGEPDSGAYDFDDDFTDVVRYLAGQRECGVHKPFRIQPDKYRLSAPAFIVDDPRREDTMELGEVIAAPHNGFLMGQNDEIYLTFNDDDIEDVNCGDVYSLYRYVKKVRHPKVRRAKLGKMYVIVGEALVTDVNLRTNIATATLVESWYDIKRGDLITDRFPISSMVVERQLQGQIEGYIVDRLEYEQALMQSREVLFIDRGRNSGVENGTVLWIMQRGDPTADRPRTRKLNKELPLFVVGKAVVFSAEETYATAVLVDESGDVQIGDEVYTVVEEAELR